MPKRPKPKKYKHIKSDASARIRRDGYNWMSRADMLVMCDVLLEDINRITRTDGRTSHALWLYHRDYRLCVKRLIDLAHVAGVLHIYSRRMLFRFS